MLDIVKEYGKKRLDLLKMEAAEKSSVGAGTATFFILAAIAGMFFIILLNIGLGLWIGSLLGNYAYGILIMAGFYLLIIIILIIARKGITNSIANRIIKAIND